MDTQYEPDELGNSHREKLAEIVSAAQELGDRSSQSASCGIVVCAGGSTMLTNAWVLLSVLRTTLGCQLDIELWHVGRQELPVFIEELFSREFGISVVDAHLHPEIGGGLIRDGWQLKIAALRHTAFDQVLLLDADQVPVTDPAGVFEWPEYKEAGAVFWPDTIDLSEANPAWELLGLEPQRHVSIESGQICIDKRTQIPALNAAMYLAHHADFFYDLVYGDKDLFLFAWLFARQPFALVPHRPFEDSRCLFQRNFEGVPIFQHRTNSKWKLTGRQHEVEEFAHLEHCLRALERLRSCWDGRIFEVPSRTTDARRMEEELIAKQHFELTWMTGRSESIQLLPGHQLSENARDYARNWHVEELEMGLELVLSDVSQPVARLRHLGSQRWKGYERLDLGSEVELRPALSERDVGDNSSISLEHQLISSALRGGKLTEVQLEHLGVTLHSIARISVGSAVKVREFLQSHNNELSETAKRGLAEIADQLEIVVGEAVLETPTRKFQSYLTRADRYVKE